MKIPPPEFFQRWDSRIARYDSRVLAPGARRRTHTAGTTKASLLGLLDVENHVSKVQKEVFEVKPLFAGFHLHTPIILPFERATHPGFYMKPPCDEAVVRAPIADAPCTAQAAPWILSAAILASSMAFIDGTVVNVALPALQTSFHATVVGMQWVVESYALFLGALILVGGSLGDLFGRRLMFLAGVGLFAAASLACGFTSNIQQLVAARSVQGVGAAFLVPGSLSIICANFDEQTRGRASCGPSIHCNSWDRNGEDFRVQVKSQSHKPADSAGYSPILSVERDQARRR